MSIWYTMTQQSKNEPYFVQNSTFITPHSQNLSFQIWCFYSSCCHQLISSFRGTELPHLMNPQKVFLSEFSSRFGLISRSASEVNISKMPVLLDFGLSAVKEVCYSIPFPLYKDLFLPSRNILRSLSHFLSSPSVSLFISLFIISGRKPLKFSLCLNIFDMLKFPFVPHIPAPDLDSFVCWLPDSSHHSICHWSQVVRGEEYKKERSKISRRCLVWQTIQSLVSDQS